MWTQDRLAAADAHLALVEKGMSGLHVVDSGASREQAALARPAVGAHVRRVGAILARARAYVAAARQTIGDVFDDMRDTPGGVGQDLRLLGQVCALVDELGSEAARHLASVDLQVPTGREPDARMLRLMLASDVRTLQAARESAQAAGRIAHELAEDLFRLPAPTMRRGREHEHHQPQQPALGPAGPPR